MRDFVRVKETKVVGIATVRNDADQNGEMTEVENITGSLMGATYDEQNGTFTDSDGSIVAHAK